MDSIKWIFFDLGSTIVDETDAYYYRHLNAVRGSNISYEQFIAEVIELQKQNLKADVMVIERYGLPRTPWRSDLEKLYPDADDTVKTLYKRGYKLGVIANQKLGSLRRLEAWGIAEYFDVIAASAEEGVAKPDPQIFLRALERAGCPAENAVMVGDRIDNDIVPAKRLGMKTVRILQSFSAYGIPRCKEETADITINSLSELLEHFV
ncbi:MAG: HAD family hydrolase [Oscillospiraceae bacterium]